MMQFFAVVGVLTVVLVVAAIVGLLAAGVRASAELSLQEDAWRSVAEPAVYRPGRSPHDPDYTGPAARLRERVTARRDA